MKSSSSRGKSHARPQRGGVRVVGKIMPFLDSDGESRSSRISISRPDGDFPSIVFGDQPASRKDCYMLDECYGQDEGISEIFSKEIKPLIQGIFQGSNASVIAYGAKGSGKTKLIQGFEETPGLASMTVFEILMLTEKTGGSVAVSCYEVCQDRVYDLLEPKEVMILEDADRKIQLKGLSKVPVESISEFNEAYFSRPNVRNPSQKVVIDVAIRSHRGLIVYVNCVDKESNNTLVGKMNFVDLAGYEDIKKNGNDRVQLAESVKVNKSLYAVLNVVYALNSNEIHVPYRETKLTRMFQDFLCKGSEAVLVACLDSLECQDTVHVVSLASRSSQGMTRYRHETIKSCKSTPRFFPPCSPSMTKRRPQLQSNSVKKHVVLLSEKKVVNDSPSMTQRKILFNDGSSIKKSVQDDTMALSLALPQDDNIMALSAVLPEDDNIMALSAVLPEESCASRAETPMPKMGTNLGLQVDDKLSIEPQDNDTMQKASQISPIVNGVEASPPLSERLRKISNSLKLLSTQPLRIISTPQASSTRVYTDSMEPKTPEVSCQLRLDCNSRFENTGTPQDILIARSAGLKKSLVQDCLYFLNKAGKEELKNLRGIGERRATYILELRETDPEPFKKIDDLRDIGLSSKQIKEMMNSIMGNF